MAKIYMGNQEAADRGLLEALRRLSDNYHIFVEFQIPSLRGQRQVDFLVIREDAIKPCIFCLEVKMERRRLRGTINGPWEYEEAPGAWRTLPVSNPRDQNPIQQAYNTARAMQTWLGSMRALIQEPDSAWPDIPTVFPRLVLPVAHPDNQLQTDSFTWRFDGYERCLDSLTTFIPRDPVPLRPVEIERLARHLGVQRLVDNEPAEEQDLNAWLRTTMAVLQTEISALRQEVRELRLTLGRGPASHAVPGGRYAAAPPPPPPPRPPEPTRDLEQAYRMLVEVVRDLRNSGRKLVFPNVQEGLWRRLGQFDVEQYGFFKFKEFLQEAERRGIVRLSVLDGVDYVSLPGDELPVAAVGAPSSLEDLTPDERLRLLDAIAQLESRSAYMIRSYIARHITASGILPLPMYEVRALVNDAVNRGLFQRGSRPFRHPATGEMQSLETLTLDPGHPWVAEALAQTAETDAPAYEAGGRAWENYESGGEWNGDQGWGNGEPAEAAPAADEAPAAPEAPWVAQEAPPAPGRRADAEPDGWEDAYLGQAARWSLAAAEADLHGPDESAPAGDAPKTDDPPAAEALPPGNGNGYTSHDVGDEFAPWQPAPPATPEPVAAETDDEDHNEPVY